MKYSEIIEDHFTNPRNVGELEAASNIGEATNEVCMDKLRLSLRIVNGTVTDATFRAEGCVPSIAVGSFLTEWMLGKSHSDLLSITPEQIEEAVGGLPRTKKHAAHLALEALHHALKKS